jgi:hypothetical protein
LSVGISEAGSVGCAGGGPERVRTHVADGGCLTGCSRCGHRGRSLDLVRADATDEATTNHLGSPELSSGERAGSCDQNPRSVIVGSLRLKETQNAFCAIGGPRGNKASFCFAQRLWRSHTSPVLDDQAFLGVPIFPSGR